MAKVKRLRWLIVPLLILIAVWRIGPQFSDFSSIYKLGRDINFFWLFLAIATQLGQYLGDGLLQINLLKIIKIKMNLKNTFRIASLNVFTAHILPIGPAGSMAAAYYFYRKLGVNSQSFIFLSMFWMALTTLALLVMTLIALFLLPAQPDLPLHPARIIAVSIALLLFAATLLLFKRQIMSMKFFQYFRKYKIFQEFLDFRKNFRHYQKALFTNKLSLSRAIVAAFIYYGANILTLTFTFLAFGYTPSLAVVVVAYSISLAVGTLSLAPAGVGATEATMILVLAQFGVPPALAVAITLLFRVISFWFPIPLGAISYLSLRRYLRKVGI